MMPDDQAVFTFYLPKHPTLNISQKLHLKIHLWVEGFFLCTKPEKSL